MFDRLRLIWNLWADYDKAVARAKKEDPMNAKNPFASKMMWLGLAESVLGTLSQFHVVESIPGPWGPIALQLFGVATMVLRMMTTQAVSFTPK